MPYCDNVDNVMAITGDGFRLDTETAGCREGKGDVAGLDVGLEHRAHEGELRAICGGGRLALARAATALGEVNLGHFLPDYTAYEELLSVFRSFTPIPIRLDPATAYRTAPSILEREIVSRGLGALLRREHAEHVLAGPPMLVQVGQDDQRERS